jgi:hypothetical protein
MLYLDQATIEGLNSLKILAMPPTVQATANATETLTVASPTQWIFTGTVSGQILKLPNATTLIAGWTYFIWNTSNQHIDIQDNGSVVLLTLRANGYIRLTLQTNTSAAGVWVYDLGGKVTGGSGLGYFLNYTEGQGSNYNPYFEKSTTTNFVAGYFNWMGADITGQPGTFTVVGSRGGATGTSYCRLYDLTHSLQICEVSWTTAAIQLAIATAFTNVPAGTAIIEVHIRNSSGGSATRLHSTGLVF